MSIEQEKPSKKHSAFKLFWRIAGIVVSIVIILSGSYVGGYFKGQTDQKAKINHKMVTYNQLESKSKGLKDYIRKAKGDKKILDERNTELESELEEKQSENNPIDNPADTEVDTEDLTAGTYEVGTDIAAARYEATSVGSGGLFVYDSLGTEVDNDFFAGSGYQYTFTLEDGETLKLLVGAELVPVEYED